MEIIMTALMLTSVESIGFILILFIINFITNF